MSFMRTLGRVGVREVSAQIGKIGLAALALVLLMPLGSAAQEAEVTANAGWVSQYFYRGILQKTSSASAGLDVTYGALSVGTWLADVGDGAEVDLFGSVGGEVEGVSLSAGFTAYLYTGQFDDTYIEANLGAGYGPLSAEFSFGQYENFGGGPPWTMCSSASQRSTRGSMAHTESSETTSREATEKSGTASRRRSSTSRSRGS